MKRIRFKRGDIVSVCLNPSEGHDQQGDYRPALVLTPAAFNQLGTAVIAPITQGSSYTRYAGFSVTLTGAGTQTQGVVLVNQIRTVDLEARGAHTVESAPGHIVDDALARVQTLFK